MKDKVLLEPSYILHTRSFRESSLIVYALTRDHGIVHLVAKGARRERSRFRNRLREFQKLLLSWSGRSELQTLVDVEQDAAPPIKLGSKALYSGLYINELLSHLLHRHDPHPDVFDLYEEVIATLGDAEKLQQQLRFFERDLLSYIGYALVLDVEAENRVSVDADGLYEYVIEHGPVRVLSGDDTTCYSGKTFLELASGTLQGRQSLREARMLMRRVLDYYLGGKQLKSRELLTNDY